MAGTASKESGEGRSAEGISEQVENGTPSTRPPYWDTDDDDDEADCMLSLLYLFVSIIIYCVHFFNIFQFMKPCVIDNFIDYVKE